MKKRALPSLGLALAVVIAGLHGAGCAEVGATTRTGEPTKEETQATAPYDLQAIDTLAKHQQEGIDLSKMADDKAVMPEVQSIATHVERDDAEELTRLEAYRTMWFGARKNAENPSLPGARGLTAQELDQLKTLVGSDFDRMFVDKMIEHHQNGVAMANDIKKNTKREELRELADEMLIEKQNEIELLQQYKSDLEKQGG